MTKTNQKDTENNTRQTKRGSGAKTKANIYTYKDCDS